MEFSWMSALYQLVLLALVILFFVGLYRFVKRMIDHTITTKETLKRIEDKLDRLIEDRLEHLKERRM